MRKTGYENFDLEFYQTESGPVVKARSFAGEAKQKFVLPFTLAEAGAFCRRLERGPEIDSALIQKFGGGLFDAVFQQDIRALYKAGLDLAAAPAEDGSAERGLRLRLHLQEVPGLWSLPWEYLFDATANRFVSLDRRTPLVRYLEIPKTLAPLRLKPPLRILALVSNPLNALPLNVETEKEKIARALAEPVAKGLIAIDWLEAATLAELQKALRRGEYHVFHFIGHGDFDEVVQRGWLAFEDENETVDRVYADRLCAVLSNHRSLRLAVLNSCKGAQSAAQNPFVGTAAALVQQGLPAVVAMQFPISDAAAVKFSGEFYAAIADGAAVDEAVTEARVAIFTAENHFEWGTPVLFMRASDGALFTVNAPAGGPGKRKPVTKRHAFIYILLTLLFGALTFVILSARKSTLMALEVFAGRISFELPPAVPRGEEVPLLQSALWANAAVVQNSQPVQLRLDSLDLLGAGAGFKNPLRIIPEPGEGKITFRAIDTELSLQEAVCDSGSQIGFERRGDRLNIEVKKSCAPPYQKFSFDARLEISVQDCRVVDAAGRDLTSRFGWPVRVKLHDMSRALTIAGVNGALQSSLIKSLPAGAEQMQFVVQRHVRNLAFAQTVYQNGEFTEVSTVDSLAVKSGFPVTDAAFSSRRDGKPDIVPEPNHFLIDELLETAAGLQVRAQGRLRSLKIVRGLERRELVPKYLNAITENPTTSVLITWMGWIITVVVPLVLHFKTRNKDE